MLLPIRRRHQHADILPDSFVCGVAKQLLRSPAKGPDLTLLVDGNNRVGRSLNDRAEPLLPLMESRFGKLTFGDIDHARLHRRLIVPPHGPDEILDPHGFAVTARALKLIPVRHGLTSMASFDVTP